MQLCLIRNRLGIRMEGPRPKFARTDGGEGGSHPSNVHDHVYAIGTINYTGAHSSCFCACSKGSPLARGHWHYQLHGRSKACGHASV